MSAAPTAPYLADLARRGHQGPVLGMDLSPGMLNAARSRAPAALLAAGDAAAVPLRDAVSDLTLAMHVLHHLPRPLEAVREPSRITSPGGQVLVVLNGHDHLRELRDLIATALAGTGGQPPRRERLHLDDGQAMLAAEFGSVTRHDFTGELLIPGPGPRPGLRRQHDHHPAPARPRRIRRSRGRPHPPGGPFRVRTHAGLPDLPLITGASLRHVRPAAAAPRARHRLPPRRPGRALR